MGEQVPEVVAGGWAVGAPGQVGLDARRLESLRADLHGSDLVNVHSLLVARDGLLVFEEYGTGPYEDGRSRTYERSFVHCTHSVTKSFTSALVGIAIERGLIDGVDVPVSTFFPEYAHLFARTPQRDLRLSHVLAMTSGLRWDESSVPYTDERNDHIAFVRATDPLRFLFELPFDHEPGVAFQYNSGLSIALGRILERATGVRADAFAQQHLFGPLGIDEFAWLVSPAPLLQTGGGLYLRPRDMLRFGQLYLDGGVHDGVRVIGQDWVERSISRQAPDFEYGYQWWLGAVAHDGGDLHTFAALGRGGQAIQVIPELSLVVVSTAWNDGTHLEQRERLLFEVLSAVA
ncbi:MAG TPA: serine hydrolase [Nitriliruptorales bacterium]